MTGKDIKIRSSDGAGEFDCYLCLPAGSAKAPAVVLASAIHSVDGDIRAAIQWPRRHKDVFDAKTREFSMGRARAILDGLRGAA